MKMIKGLFLNWIPVGGSYQSVIRCIEFAFPHFPHSTAAGLPFDQQAAPRAKQAADLFPFFLVTARFMHDDRLPRLFFAVAGYCKPIKFNRLSRQYAGFAAGDIKLFFHCLHTFEVGQKQAGA